MYSYYCKSKVLDIKRGKIMDRQKLIDAGIDYENGVERLMGNTEMYEHFLQMFLEDDSFKNLDDAMHNHHYPEAFLQAHTLKGVAGNLSMGEFYQNLILFVEMLRNSTDIPGAVKLYPEIKKEYEDIITAIL